MKTPGFFTGKHFHFSLLLLYVVTVCSTAMGQQDYYSRYGVPTVSLLKEYKEQVVRDSSQQLIALDSYIPGIRLDIRYATRHNIMKRPLYKTAAAFLRLPAAKALRDVELELQKMGYGLKIFDGYRPYSVTVAFYEKFLDSVFVASPYRGSRHNRGCAVDLTLIDLRTGRDLPMPTAYDSFTPRAHSDYPGLPPAISANRELLKQVMVKHGFLVYKDEWWHFDFAGWNNYPLMDIPLEELK